MSQFFLHKYTYSPSYPITVRHASLLNAVKDLTSQVVYDAFLKEIKLVTNKPELKYELYILKRDSNWVKKMFTGKDGLDMSTHTTTPIKKKTPLKRKTPVDTKAKKQIKKKVTIRSHVIQKFNIYVYVTYK